MCGLGLGIGDNAQIVPAGRGEMFMPEQCLDMTDLKFQYKRNP